jgi:cytochrome c-type biogenesis protein CcmH
MDVLVERLAAKMAEHPDNLEGWVMLGRSYFAINQPAKALQALERAHGLAPENPEVIIAYAQAVAANAQGRLAGRPAELIAKALEIDPVSRTGRWLDGLRIYQAGDFEGAVSRWEALLADLDPDSDEADELRAFIADARERAAPSSSADAKDAVPTPPDSSVSAQAPKPATTAPAIKAAEAEKSGDEGGRLTVKVTLAEPLWKEADVNQTLFVYAKAVSGPPMPLAVKRLRTADLPVTVTLDDSMAMMPAMRLSAFPEVTVGARISASGQANPGSGDLEGEVSPVKPGASGPVEVVIDRVRP